MDNGITSTFEEAAERYHHAARERGVGVVDAHVLYTDFRDGEWWLRPFGSDVDDRGTSVIAFVSARTGKVRFPG